MNFFLNWFHPCRTVMLFVVWTSAVVYTKAQTASALNADQSWTANTQTVTTNANPSRTTESHIESGNRTLDKKTVEVLGPDGEYQPYVEVETETIQESATATRSITHTYDPGADGHEQLTQVTEAETQKSADGVADTVQTMSNPDSLGNLQVVEREIATTTKGSESQYTHSTIYLPDVSGNLAPSMQIDEKQEHGHGGEMKTKKTTLLPDANRGWKVEEVREQTVKGDAQNRTTDERTSRRDYEDNVSPVSEAVASTTQANGETTTIAKTFSVDVPGMARDERLHPVQQAKTVQKVEPGRRTTEQLVEEPESGDAALGTSIATSDVVVVGSSGTDETITVTAQYPDGYPSIVSVETRKFIPLASSVR